MTSSSRFLLKNLTATVPATIITLAMAAPAAAHVTGHGVVHGGFAAGMSHPIGGLDHLLAMVAVGVLAARTGGAALWSLPLTFIAVMSGAAALGANGIGLPLVEPGIAASVLVLGLLVAWAGKLPQAVGVGLCAAFALFHGHAHGTELAPGASFAAYLAGFALSTAALHGAGIAAGLGGAHLLANRDAVALWTWRAAGSAMALVGGAMVVGLV